MIKIVKNASINDMTFTRKPFSLEREAVVREIIDDVKQRGDEALVEYNRKFDGESDKGLLVTCDEIDDAYARIDKSFIAILSEAKKNIEDFHERQKRDGFEIKKDGILLGQRFTPIERAGVYVPGGTAAYPSSVLMNVIPALVAGVSDITLCTPAKNGVIKDEILAAAKLCGVTRVVRLGGAQAIAAMAYGTQSVPKVDKIVGPGNVFVALAKKAVYGDVGIDMIAGPSEILIIADSGADPVYIACDLLSQAEHDELATAALITDSEALAERVQAEIEVQLARLSRRDIAEKSIYNNGVIFVVKDLDDAVKFSDEIAPEHLELYVEGYMAMLGKVRNAGSIFLGAYSPEPLGDYFAGPNHTLPTGGSARFSSPLSVDDFVKKSSYICYNESALTKAADKIAGFAEREGLQAHANAVLARKKK